MGVKLFLDTNAIVALFNENPKLKNAIKNADSIFTSIINELEFKSFTKLSLHDELLFNSFLSMIKVIDLNTANTELKDKIIEIRNTYHLKLPDAIIAASALINKAILVTGDRDFRKVKELELLSIS